MERKQGKQERKRSVSDWSLVLPERTTVFHASSCSQIYNALCLSRGNLSESLLGATRRAKLKRSYEIRWI